VKLYTVGFTKKSAEQFFDLLGSHGVECLVDIRQHPGGQLAGFAKQGDLAFFLRRLIGCDYLHMPLLAPSEELLSAYRKDHRWPNYQQGFEALMEQRDVPGSLDRDPFLTKTCCLLCSEASPEHCHRRLVAERLARRWPELEVIDLV
jgi:uncharacterized protein (DUF488 family)